MKRKWIVGFRLVLGLVLLLVVGYGSYSVLERSARNSIFRIQEIRFEGARHLDARELDELIRSTFPENTLKLNLEKLREFVESETWVETAQVRRQLPDRIIIRVVERKPVAVATIDGEPRVVDREGVVLGRFGPEFHSIDQPIVKGLRNVALENAAEENRLRMSRYLDVLADLDAAVEKYSLSISEIIVEDPEKIAVVPTEVSVPVYLGNNRFRERFETYLAGLDHLGEIREQHGAIESIDVTYDNQMIVHTPQESEIGTDTGD